MSKKMGKVAQNVLNEFFAAKESFETLYAFMEQLETKQDPEPVELHMIENIYSFIEKYKIMESNIRNYVKNINESTCVGSKIMSLYSSDGHLEDLKKASRNR